MIEKIAAFILHCLSNVTAGVAIFFFMLLAMNGFSESDANYGLGTYIILAAVVLHIDEFRALVLTGLLVRRKYRGVRPAVAIAVPVFIDHGRAD
jgi:hypothetical protein